MKTKYARRPKWVLWLMIVAFLFFMACDGTTMCIPSGSGPDSTPTPRPCSVVEHFDYPVGSLPPSWSQFGSAGVNPRIEEVEGNKVLRCSQFEQGQEKFLIYGGLDCQAKQITVKLKFLSNHDWAGLVIFVGQGDDIRFALNPFNDLTLVEEHRGGGRPFWSEKKSTIEVGINYWLRIVPNYQAMSLKALLSTDGSSFTQINEATGLQKMTGKFGLAVFGLHPPEVLIDDFIVESQDQPVQPPKSLKVPPKIVLTSGIWVDEEDIWLNIETVTAKFTIRNESEEEVTFAKLLATGRGVDQDLGYRDFTARPNVTLKPYQEYAYEGTLAFPLTGKYRIFAAYLLPDTYQLNPANNSAWWTDVPPAPNSGAVAEVRVGVREQTPSENRYTQFFTERYGLRVKNWDAEWTEVEVNLLHEALANLSDTFYRMPTLKTIKRAHALKDPADYYPQVNMILFSDDFFKAPNAIDLMCDDLPRYQNAHFNGRVGHELTHPLQRLDLGSRKVVGACSNPLVLDYARLTKWDLDPSVEKCSYDASRSYHGGEENLPGYRWPFGLCSQRAKQDVLEDMAEAVRFYVMNPDRIRNNPRYEFIKERIFSGREY